MCHCSRKYLASNRSLCSLPVPQVDILAATIALARGQPVPKPIARSDSLPDMADDEEVSSMEGEEGNKEESEKALRKFVRQASRSSTGGRKGDLRRGRSSGNLTEMVTKALEVDALEDRLKSASMAAPE